MFKTTKATAIFAEPMGRDGVQFWSHIEHELTWPWFYLQVVQEDSQAAFRTMLMLSSTSDLGDIVSACTHQVWLEKAYLATPAHMNDTSGWALEALLKVEVLQDCSGTSMGARFFVENGKVRSLGEIHGLEGISVEICFCAERHLGPVGVGC